MVVAPYIRGTEIKWSICERECLALVEAIKQFQPYLSHNHFIAVFYCLGKVSIVWANSVVLSIAERRCRID